jgi:hypothetical protein
LLLEKYLLAPSPTNLLIELHYLPCLDYISGLMRFGGVQLEAQEHYQKQSYRNRCYIRTANKVDVLTVPVQKGTHHQPIRDLKLATDRSWQLHHWRSLQAAYGKAPFFEYYAPDFAPVYQKSWVFLFDLTYELLTICLKSMQVRIPINLTKWYEKTASAGLFDARSKVNPANKPETYVFHQPIVYPQNFGQDFVPNLSIIDLLFCQGPSATDVLMAGLRE